MIEQNVYAGLNAYLTYIAIRMHFSNSNYDYFKYNGQTTTKPESFLKRKDKFFFEKIERKYKDDDLLMLLVSNFIHDEKSWIRTIATNQGEKIYLDWKKKTNGLSYHFQEQLKLVANEIEENKKSKIMFQTSGMHPPVLRMYISGELSLETMVILNYLFDFVSYFNSKLEFDPIWEQARTKILGYQPFLLQYANISKEKYLDTFQKILG